MELTDAVEKAGVNDSVRRLKGYFLGSSFTSLPDAQAEVKEWTLLYYNPDKNTVVDCFVSEKFVTVGEETPALSKVTEVDTDGVEIDVEHALAKSAATVKVKPINVLVSLHNKEIENKTRLIWTIGLVLPDFSLKSLDIDAKSGKTLREETTQLIRRL